MATRYFGVNRGGQQTDVTQGSSTTSKKVELVVDLASSLTQTEVLLAIENIANYIIASNTWPPA